MEFPCAIAALCFRDTVLAAETCEELFTPEAPHIGLALAGTVISIEDVRFCRPALQQLGASFIESFEQHTRSM